MFRLDWLASELPPAPPIWGPLVSTCRLALKLQLRAPVPEFSVCAFVTSLLLSAQASTLLIELKL